MVGAKRESKKERETGHVKRGWEAKTVIEGGART